MYSLYPTFLMVYAAIILRRTFASQVENNTTVSDLNSVAVLPKHIPDDGQYLRCGADCVLLAYGKNVVVVYPRELSVHRQRMLILPVVKLRVNCGEMASRKIVGGRKTPSGIPAITPTRRPHRKTDTAFTGK